MDVYLDGNLKIYEINDFKEIIPSLKLKSSNKCSFEYFTYWGHHTLSDYINF